MASPTLHERPDRLRAALAPFAARLAAGRQVVHVPRLLGLRQPRRGLVFHAVPELFFQLVGSNRFTCPSERFVLGADEIAVMPRWLPHGERVTDGAREPFAGIVVGLDAGRATFRWQCMGDAARPSIAWSIAHDGPQSDRVARYLDDLAEERAASVEYRASLLRAAVALLLDVLPARDGGGGAGNATQAFSPKVQRCREIIQSDLADPELSVRRLAQELRCTPDHLSRLFRTECGVALNAFLRAERLHHARTLLADPSLNVSEIAWACGFRSPNYFIRRFRGAHGATPGKSRRR
ncbi:MAG TPA: helix-turn-helix transcriptional regulator [Opitutaceae bacterium]|nr:helix-turn-helix transcriptional regulator [Opitutaceae bacterium]